MPTWGEILKELLDYQRTEKKLPYDAIRRKYLLKLFERTKRNVIFYASNWMDQPPPPGTDINISDLQGFMEVIKDLKGENLDFIIHSPGGSAEAAEAIIKYIRKKFKNIRVIVPYAAMSAASMMVCSGNSILMGKHSYIGPIDPQIILNTQVGRQMIPAQSILDQFRLAKEEIKDPSKVTAWIPILPQYGPALLIQCQNAQTLSNQLVKDWLTRYMFEGEKDAELKAENIAKYLGSHEKFKSHSRYIDRDETEQLGLKVEKLENDPILQDLVLSVFHCYMHTFSGTPSTKIIENHLGKALVRLSQQINLPIQISGPPLPPKKPEGM